MEKAERLNKYLYKIELLAIKVIPMTIAACYALNSLMSYFGINFELLGYFAHTSVLTLSFLYISSFVFKFCIYHRMFIYYIASNELLNIFDYYIGIPVTDKNLFVLNVVLVCVTLFIILFFHVEHNKKFVIANY